MLKQLLFPVKPDGTATSAMLLIARIVFGILLMNHGIQKWTNFQELSAVFPDPLGVGSPLSLGLAIFGELACSMAFIIGFLYRLAMIPMVFTMAVAFFVIHGNDPFATKELAFVYLVVFIYNPQIQISAESETKRSIFRKRDKTKRSKKESAQHSKSRNKSFVMTSVSAL